MAPNENAADEAQNATATNAQDNGTAVVDGQGPPSELPDPVPEFVTEIHSAIRDAISNGVETLGQTISNIASNAAPAEGVAVVVETASMIPL